jgi:hypothetical protein
MSDNYLVYPYFQVNLIQQWLVEADSLDEALESFESGEMISERVPSGGEHKPALSEAEKVSDEKAKKVRQDEYTVVGYGAHHPQGFVHVVEADSYTAAAEEYPDANVIAVFEGAQEYSRALEAGTSLQTQTHSL